MRDNARALFLQGLGCTLIAQQLALPIGTVRKWAARGQWNDFRANHKPQPGLLCIRGEDFDRANKAAADSQRLRSTLAQVLELHAAALSLVPAKPNLSLLREVGEVLEIYARTAKIVFNWGSEGQSGLILVSELGAVGKAIDLPSAAVQVKDTPIGSGPAALAAPSTVDSAQVVTDQGGQGA